LGERLPRLKQRNAHKKRNCCKISVSTKQETLFVRQQGLSGHDFLIFFFLNPILKVRSLNMIHGAVPTTALTSMGYAISASRNGRMSLPVAPANYIYSHFKHVSGVPAPEGVRGVTIDKLKILDVLIERLSQMKKRPEMDIELSPSEERIDALIEQYRSQIRQTQATNTVIPYTPQTAAPAGMLFNLVA
jgi:hypothetical protein